MALRLWKYTASKAAQDWVTGAGYIVTTEDALPTVEAALKITVDGPASDAEIAADPKRIEYRPGYPRYNRRAFLGEKDVEYLRLKGLGDTDAAISRADALIAADDLVKGRR